MVQSGEHMTLDLKVTSSSPTLGVKHTGKKTKQNRIAGGPNMHVRERVKEDSKGFGLSNQRVGIAINRVRANCFLLPSMGGADLEGE